MTSDSEPLAGYVDIWWSSVGDLLTLLDGLDERDWSRPTRLPGWTVHDLVAHVAELEAVLAGAPEETLQFEPPPHVRNPLGYYTEQGVVARRGATPAELIAELCTSTTARKADLDAAPPTAPAAPPPRTPGGVAWDTGTLLRNRPLDVWMHEQDLRAAIDHPGGLDTPGARHTIGYFGEALGRVLARGAEAPPGSSLVVEVSGYPPKAFAVTAERRGAALAEAPADPTVRLAMDVAAFVELIGGRVPPGQAPVTVTGDAELGQRVLAAMALTP